MITPGLLWTQGGHWNSFIPGWGNLLRPVLEGTSQLWHGDTAKNDSLEDLIGGQWDYRYFPDSQMAQMQPTGDGPHDARAGLCRSDARWLLCDLRSPRDPHLREKNKESWTRELSLYRISEETWKWLSLSEMTSLSSQTLGRIAAWELISYIVENKHFIFAYLNLYFLKYIDNINNILWNLGFSKCGWGNANGSLKPIRESVRAKLFV